MRLVQKGIYGKDKWRKAVKVHPSLISSLTKLTRYTGLSLSWGYWPLV